MDLLSGYGSDASEDEARAEGVPGAEATAVNGHQQNDGEDSAAPALLANLQAALPAAGATKAKARRRPVQFRIPIKVDYGTDSDEEDFLDLLFLEQPKKEEQPKKKGRCAKESVRFSESLPAPKNTSLFDTRASKKVRSVAGDDEDDISAMKDPIASEPSPFLPAEGGNEAYRVDDVLEDYIPTAGNGPYMGGGMNAAPGSSMPAVNSAPQASAAHTQQEQPGDAQYDVAAYAQYDDQANAQYDPAYTQAGYEASTSEAGPSTADAVLRQAFEEEAQKAVSRSKRADPFASGAVKFVEVDQKKLRYVSPQQKEAANAARTAFGADYEQRLRMEAGPAPTGKAKRKHQISSLYHAAKMKELEMMDMRGQALKTKAETQAKYGW